MGLLLYKSDEMYSSTELIRKSKMIFDKVLDKKIDKAIILRDGKPSFLLMEFQKYEKIMAEYEELKEYVSDLKKQKTTKNILKKTTVTSASTASITKEKEIEIKEEPSYPKASIQTITEEDKIIIEEKKSKIFEEEHLSEEDEISDALQTIESMNFDEDMKKEAELKIKARIIEARAERLKVLSDDKQYQDDLKEELILQNQLKEAKMKKDRELQEFWDT